MVSAVAWRIDDAWTANAEFRTLVLRAGNRKREPGQFIPANEAKRLLELDPRQAESRARDILVTAPQDPVARLVLGSALRRRREFDAARAILGPLATAQPQMGDAWRELGMLLVHQDEKEPAISALLRAIDLGYRDTDAWYTLGDLLPFPDADQSGSASSDGRIAEAVKALREARLADAEVCLRDVLQVTPDQPVALKLLGDTLLRDKRWDEARPQLEAALKVSPGYIAARFRLATMLFAFGHFGDSLPHIAELLSQSPGETLYSALKALALGWNWEFEPAIAEFSSLLARCPSQPGLWLEYGRILRAAREDGSAAFVRTIELLPSCVDAYIAIAGMKSFRFDESWVARIRTQLERPDLATEDRARLHFALGRLFEDLAHYGESFKNYEATNEILLKNRHYGVEASTKLKQRSIQLFTPAFFRQRMAAGHPEHRAIFITGLPRSGSTLLEQILSSHSEIEGLGEIDNMRTIVTEVIGSKSQGPRYPFAVATLGADRLRALGERYMSLARARQKTDRKYFTDKSLSNFAHLGLIHLILPNARFIDVRRHPLDCGFSCYKHYFPFGQPLTYSLEDIGRAYVDYVELMAHFDEILPGKVYRVIYEQLIADPEGEVRRALEFLRLPFEEECLRFHENKRFVKTLSFDQVRMPLYRSGMEHWRHYEPWLGPLKRELGCVLEAYPEVPRFFPQLKARLRTNLDFGPRSNVFNVVKGVRQVSFGIGR